MGCDIHFVIEAKTDRRWIGVYSTDLSPTLLTIGEANDRYGEYDKTFADYYRRPEFKDRNYAFFAELAGVRGKGPSPKGIPSDLSELAKDNIDAWATDGHSHSYDDLDVFVLKWMKVTDPDAFARYTAAKLKGERSTDLRFAIGDYHNEDYAYRVVYWFDN